MKKPTSFTTDPKDEFLEDNDVPPGHSPATAPADNLDAPKPVPENIHPELPVAIAKQYKLISADATINGVKYSTHYTDHGGHYGLFMLTEEQASVIEGQGWKLVECGGEDDFSVHPEAAQGEENEDEFLNPPKAKVGAKPLPK